MVGCVLVRDGRVIGEGFHQRVGGPHAEPLALGSCDDPRGATAFVTLEPCCHTDKRTPPCAPALVRAGIERVVAGCTDPSPQVNGNGLELLREAGVTVELASGEIAARCRQLIAPFALSLCAKRPYVTMKLAVSRDGCMTRAPGERTQITGPQAARVTHALRGRSDAVLVSGRTVMVDDPLLTARVEQPARVPTRVVVTSSLDLPLDRQVFVSARQHPTVVYACTGASGAAPEQAEKLREMGVELIEVPSAGGHPDSLAILHDLFERRCTHVLVEAGPTLARGWIRNGSVDRVWVMEASMELGCKDERLCAPKLEFPDTGSVQLGPDRLTEYLNPRSPGFAGAFASADLVLAGFEDVSAGN